VSIVNSSGTLALEIAKYSARLSLTQIR
jgi:hypothetical protein